MAEAFDPYYLWLGVPPDEQPPNHYRLLGIKLLEGNADVISGAADRQMAHVRSFQTGKHATESQKILNELAAARVCLLSPDKKAPYDLALRDALARRQTVAAPPPAAAPNPVVRPAPTVARPLPAAQPIAAARPTPAPTALANSLGFDPLDQSSAPRHRKRKSSQQQSAVVAAAVVALLAVAGLAFVMIGSSEQKPEPVAVRAAAVGKAALDAETPPQAAQPKRRKIKPTIVGAAESDDSAADDSPQDEMAVADNAAMSDEADADSNPMEDSGADDSDFGKSSDAAMAASAPKEPVPSADDLKSALADIQKLFKDDFTRAKKPDQKTALAQKLLELAADSSAPLERFALLSEARRLATSAGDASLAMQAIDEQADHFELDRLQAAAELVEGLGNRDLPTAQQQALVEVALPLVDAASADGQFKVARRIATASLAAARKSNQGEAAKTLARQSHDLAGSEKMADAADAARKTLADNPQDADAHLALGKFLCFVRDQWAEGLPHLAAGSDAALRAAAERDLAGATAAADQVQVGDAWWDLAAEAKGLDKDRLQARAAHWYQQAIGELAGLNKAKVEKRLADSAASPVAKAGNASQITTYLVELPAKEIRVFPNFRAPVSLQGAESPHGIILHPTSDSSSHAAYSLAGRYQSFSGRAGVNDTAGAHGSHTALFFRVVGDGHELWKSRALKNTGDSQEFRVSVAGVRKLELFVDCPGFDGSAQAVWFEPELTSGKGGGREQKTAAATGAAVPPSKAGRARGKITRLTDLPQHLVGGQPRNSVISLKGVRAEYGVFVHPTRQSSAHVTYDLDAPYRTFAGRVGVNDSAGGNPATPLTFRIIGDASGTRQEIWKSRPLQQVGDSQEFRVSIEGVHKLELLVECPGSDDYAHAIWFEPQLIRGAQSVAPAKKAPPPASGKWIDLLKDVDLASQHLQGAWEETPDGVRASKPETKLRLPVPARTDFLWHVEFTRTFGSDAIYLIFPVGPSQTALLLSGWNGAAGGFDGLDGGAARDVATTVRPGNLENGHRYSVDIAVRSVGKDVKVDVEIDGKPYLTWSGDPARLGFTTRWMPHDGVFGLSANEPTIFHVAKLKLVGGKALLAAEAAAKETAGGTTTGPKPSGSKAPADAVSKQVAALMKDAVLIATFDESTIIRRPGEVFVKDLSGKQKPGRVVGATFVPGKAGRAIALQAAGQHVDWGDDLSLSPHFFTICAWVSPATHANHLTDVFSKHSEQQGCRGFVLRLAENIPHLVVGMGTGDWHVLRLEAPIATDQWTHYVATHDAKRSCIYLNGRLITGPASDGPASVTSEPCFIGATASLDDLQFFGLIDEVALFDRGLSADEVMQIYDLGSAGKSLPPAPKK